MVRHGDERGKRPTLERPDFLESLLPKGLIRRVVELGPAEQGGRFVEDADDAAVVVVGPDL
jgi:hypothetical protein